MLAGVLAATLLLASLLAACQTPLNCMIRSVPGSVRSCTCMLQVLALQGIIAPS